MVNRKKGAVPATKLEVVWGSRTRNPRDPFAKTLEKAFLIPYPVMFEGTPVRLFRPREREKLGVEFRDKLVRSLANRKFTTNKASDHEKVLGIRLQSDNDKQPASGRCPHTGLQH